MRSRQGKSLIASFHFSANRTAGQDCLRSHRLSIGIQLPITIKHLLLTRRTAFRLAEDLVGGSPTVRFKMKQRHASQGRER